MRPNNEFTNPDQRFFFQVNREVECHDSLDLASVPGTEYIPGQDHYAILRNQAGQVYGVDLGLGNHNMPVGVTLLGIKGKPRQYGLRNSTPRMLRPGELDGFDDDCSYMPGDESNDIKVIVQIDTGRFRCDINDSRFDSKGVAILPYGEPMPSHTESGIADENIRYSLLGFIDENDKLLSWHGESGEGTSLIDFCVANRLRQNRLEELLLYEALPFGGSLSGMAKSIDVVRAYLQYFDERHDTAFFPQQDPRFTHAPSEFGELTDEQRARYRMLTELANR
jgi:hypothetical protein